jgi:hypothetical protein
LLLALASRAELGRDGVPEMNSSISRSGPTWEFEMRRSPRAPKAARPVQDQVLARSEADAMLLSLRKLPVAQTEVIALAFFGS